MPISPILCYNSQAPVVPALGGASIAGAIQSILGNEEKHL
jgi:hypothetical protein